jgi:glycosyltransferase involved in cell wall biosynthesis
MCSEWIKKRVHDNYNIAPNKIDVVEFGANIPTPQTYSCEISMDVCRLLFIGREWERKGGNTLLEIYQILKNNDFLCHLTIIGVNPPIENKQDENITVIPYLDKSQPDDLNRLCKILSESHFLILPTKFDAFGIVFCEASAFAVPSIAANVGGVGSAIHNGKNGYLLESDATANDYANIITSVFRDKEKYIELRRSSRIEFETRLNWDVWGKRIDEILTNTVNGWSLSNK